MKKVNDLYKLNFSRLIQEIILSRITEYLQHWKTTDSKKLGIKL